MRQRQFETRHEAEWRRVSEAMKSGGGEEFPGLYRRICHHLAVARERRYGDGLVRRLEGLALAGHHTLYSRQGLTFRQIAAWLLEEFPLSFRRHWRFMLTATLFSLGPFLLIFVAILRNPEAAGLVLDAQTAASMEEMYSPAAEHFGRQRDVDSDLLMFGHYVNNNIGIDFRIFSGGLLAGVGSLFFLIFNGLYIGAIAAHLTVAGCGDNFWPFVSGHSALELTAMVVAGGAGLRLGWSLLAPGSQTRGQALRDAGRDGAVLIGGAAVMTLGAAFVEAFWSSRADIAPWVKYLFGASQWTLVLLFFAAGGRRRVA